MDPNLRNLKDFLTLYNKVTEICFFRCVESLNERDLIARENDCVNKCVTKFAGFNQKMMSVYVEVQTDINTKRMQELEETQKAQTIPAATTSTTPAATTAPAAGAALL